MRMDFLDLKGIGMSNMGRIRLPLLLKGWKVLDTFGFDDSLFG